MLLALVNAPGLVARGLAYDAPGTFDLITSAIATADPPADLFTVSEEWDAAYYRLLQEPAGSPARVWLAATLARILAELIG